MSETLSKLSQLEAGVYQDALRERMTLSGWLNDKARKGELSEDLYRKDVHELKGKDAFSQLLSVAGIRTKGELAQTGDAFFSDPSNRVLFPEFVSREYRDAERDLLPVFVQLSDLVTNREGITGSAYRSGIISSNQEADMEFGRVSEGAELPVYTVKLSDKAINVFKYGGVLKWPYEAVRRASLPMLTRYVGKIARAQRKRKIKAALAVALEGDGNSNPALDSASGAAFWTFADLIDLHFKAAGVGSQVSTIIGDSTEIAEILGMFMLTTDGRPSDRPVAFTDAGGALPSPLGMMLKLTIPGSVLEGSQKLLGVDTQDGLVEVYENGSEITESGKLITEQFDIITMSENLGYAKPEVNAFHTKTRV